MDDDEQNVTFLYKLTDGICEKSFGMNVATMAGIPKAVVDRATEMAEKTEIAHKMKDTTYAMEVEGEPKTINITPAVIEDLAYLFSSKQNKQSVARIVNSFTRLNL
jgi:DNA mismatch repair protein MSH6